jgi:hypothetical protein
MTGQDVMTQAREFLSDQISGQYRWTDAELLQHVREGIREVYQRRPDLRLQSNGTLLAITDPANAAATLSLSDDYRAALVSWTCYRALSQDDADRENAARSRSFFEQFQTVVAK